MYPLKLLYTKEIIIFTIKQNFSSQIDIKQSLVKARKLKELTNWQLMLIGHRGMGPSSILGSHFDRSYVLPENSLGSFNCAAMLGADGIELDVFASKDNNVMVIHDNELWKNVYGNDRSGRILPRSEVQHTYMVCQKTLSELKTLSIGPDREKIPTLEEVFVLVDQINMLRGQKELPFILNIEIKDNNIIAQDLLIKKIQKHIYNHNTRISFDNIYFCSFNHQCLKELKAQARSLGIFNIKIAASIKTATLFGKENVNPDFTVKEGATYDQNGLNYLKFLIEEQDFTAYDAVLWDISKPLVQLANDGGKQLHASTSDFRLSDLNPGFALFLLRISSSSEVPIYFKSDEVSRARDILVLQAEYMEEAYKERQKMLATEAYKERQQILAIEAKNERIILLEKEDQSHFSDISLDICLERPTPYSKQLSELINKKKKLEEKFEYVSRKVSTINTKLELVNIRKEISLIEQKLSSMELKNICIDTKNDSILATGNITMTNEERCCTLTYQNNLEKRKQEIDKLLIGVGVRSISFTKKHYLRLELLEIEDQFKSMCTLKLS